MPIKKFSEMMAEAESIDPSDAISLEVEMWRYTEPLRRVSTLCLWSSKLGIHFHGLDCVEQYRKAVVEDEKEKTIDVI